MPGRNGYRGARREGRGAAVDGQRLRGRATMTTSSAPAPAAPGTPRVSPRSRGRDRRPGRDRGRSSVRRGSSASLTGSSWTSRWRCRGAGVATARRRPLAASRACYLHACRREVLNMTAGRITPRCGGGGPPGRMPGGGGLVEHLLEQRDEWDEGPGGPRGARSGAAGRTGPSRCRCSWASPTAPGASGDRPGSTRHRTDAAAPGSSSLAMAGPSSSGGRAHRLLEEGQQQPTLAGEVLGKLVEPLAGGLDDLLETANSLSGADCMSSSAASRRRCTLLSCPAGLGPSDRSHRQLPSAG